MIIRFIINLMLFYTLIMAGLVYADENWNKSFYYLITAIFQLLLVIDTRLADLQRNKSV